MTNSKSTKEAANQLGVSLRRVQQLIKNGTLPAIKCGRDYFIDEADLSNVMVYQKRGRPRKQSGVKSPESGVNEFETLENPSIEEKEQSGVSVMENLILPDIWKEKSESEIARQNLTKLDISEEKDDSKTTHRNITKYNISEDFRGNKDSIAAYENLTKPYISPQLKNNSTDESRPENLIEPEIVKDDFADIADLLITFPGK